MDQCILNSIVLVYVYVCMCTCVCGPGITLHGVRFYGIINLSQAL